MGFKRSHVVMFVAGALVLIVGAALLTLHWPKSSAPDAAVSTSHTVLYEAEGAGARGLRSARITLQSADGGTQQSEINLPLKNRQGGTGITIPGFSTGAFVYLSVQNTDAAGSVTCRITVDGTVISENTSSGGYVIASCKGRVP